MRFLVATLLLFTALTAVMTYPQILHMSDAVHDDGDPLLNAWTLAWVAHQLPRAPAHLFDANIFYPERRTLAFSETLLAPAVVVAPLHWMGAGPILVHNIVFLSGFIVSGAGMALLVRMLTGHAGAAVLAGLVFAFLPYRIDHYAHLQLQQTQCLPLALWAFHRLLRTARPRDGVLLGLFAAGQILSCMYYGLFLVPYMAVVCGTLSIADGRMPGRRMTALAIALAIAMTATIPVGRAYLGARQAVGERNRAEVAEGSATWRSYLGPPATNVVYGKLLARFGQPERRLFPGFVAMALAVAGLWPRKHQNTKRDPRWSYAAGLILAFDLSLGRNGLLFPLLYDHVLPFRALRSPARMGVIVGFSLAVLAGYGVSRVVERVRSARTRATVVMTLGLLMLVEYASWPIPLQPIPRALPEVYVDLLRERGDGPDTAVIEYPLSAADDPTYMYYSTFHWQSLANGYSGFFPPSYLALWKAMTDFPGDPALDAIRARGVRYLLVHQERMIGDRYVRLIQQLDRRSDLSVVSRRPSERYGQHGEISLYRIAYARTDR